ncbi:preprotein translocase subunit YajC [Mumia flava]|uniref:Preprotein translocase subunit YajC n=1 Tax=Mumia flava TaxID=1348852 RepID=A0A2M9BD50_9ACTN|nr:preprotein translocase subunit YajC [Mumia flava]PJJ55878.1 preprotein translocase subunit YajC [Mumia flava]
MELGALLPLILLAGVFYFLIIRPQSKRRREFVDMQSRVELGAEVMLTSGIFGTVTGLDEDSMELTIAPGVEIRVHRNVVAKILTPTSGGADDPRLDDPASSDDDAPSDKREENGA